MDPIEKDLIDLQKLVENSSEITGNPIPEEKSESVVINKKEDENDILSPNTKRLVELADDKDFELRTRLVESKTSRKQAEAEKKMLLNRIQLLKIESLKAFLNMIG